MAQIKGLYAAAGYPLVFLAAILEATLFIGLYIPGSTVVLLGVAMAKTGVVWYPLVFIFGTAGLVIGYAVNYFLGKYGWYHILVRFGLERGLEIAKKRIEKYDTKAILIGYFFPGSASLLSTAAGILQMPFKKFLLASLLAQGFWGLFWGSLAYFFGLPAIELLMKYFIFVLAGLILVWFFKRVIL